MSRALTFLASSVAPIAASAIGIVAFSLLLECIDERVSHYIAGLGFMLIAGLALYGACGQREAGSPIPAVAKPQTG